MNEFEDEDEKIEYDWTRCGYCGEEYYGEVGSRECISCFLDRDEEE